VNIELKYYGPGQHLEQRVIELVEAHGMASEVVIMSLKYEGIRKVKSLRPQWRVGLLAARTVGDLTKADVDFLAVNVKLATRRFIRLAHRHGKDVYVWTVNDPATMSCMIGRGVDSIITDEPALARSVLRQRARMSSVERLLVEVAALLGARAESNLSIDDV
jgi:glycerophosphoryl diester phosphodiesterase